MTSCLYILKLKSQFRQNKLGKDNGLIVSWTFSSLRIQSQLYFSSLGHTWHSLSGDNRKQAITKKHRPWPSKIIKSCVTQTINDGLRPNLLWITLSHHIRSPSGKHNKGKKHRVILRHIRLTISSCNSTGVLHTHNMTLDLFLPLNTVGLQYHPHKCSNRNTQGQRNIHSALQQPRGLNFLVFSEDT